MSRFSSILAASAVVLVAAGCGGSSGTATSNATSKAVPTSGKDAAIAAQLPKAVADQGSLTVAADASYAPNEFKAADGTTVIGMDADLAQALGQVLGLKVKVVNAGFDSIIPGLAAGRYDLGMSSFTDTKEREKTVDFVTYFSAGTSFFVKAGSGPAVSGLADLCGHKVAVESGTTQEADAKEQSKKCTADGKPAVNVEVFQDQGQANLALSSGRADVSMADSPVADYQVQKSNGQFKLAGTPYGTAPYGIAIPKGNGMAKPVLAALQKLMSDGTYKSILTKWGVSDGAISNPVINGATS